MDIDGSNVACIYGGRNFFFANETEGETDMCSNCTEYNFRCIEYPKIKAKHE